MRKRKILLSLCATVALSVLGGLSVKHFQIPEEDDCSSLLMQNVEALSSNKEEGNGGPTPCGGPKINGDCQSENTVNCKDLTGCQ